MPRLDRFKQAQDSYGDGFETALHELQAGGKRGHWIWYIFPQISGLEVSGMSQTFAIEDENEAVDFLRDPELRARRRFRVRAKRSEHQVTATAVRRIGCGRVR